MEVYHHTKYENLKKIIKREGLSFRGSYYEEFSDTDYKWTKEIVSPIIKNICDRSSVGYNEDSSFCPIVICFGKSSNSDYMWTKYADKYSGVQLILNSNKIKEYAINKLDYYNFCRYLEEKEQIGKFLETENVYPIECKNDCQYNLEAISVLIKSPEFAVEEEFRYVHAYSKLSSVNYENYLEKENDAFEECVPDEDDIERFVCFPKETLIGIRLGYNSSGRLNEVKQLLSDNAYDLSKLKVEVYHPNIMSYNATTT